MELVFGIADRIARHERITAGLAHGNAEEIAANSDVQRTNYLGDAA